MTGPSSSAGERPAQAWTSEAPLSEDPCSVAGCPSRQVAAVRLHLGGVGVDVPLCAPHAEHWRRAEPWSADDAAP